MTEKKIVLPGDKLSTSEELLSGDGTFEEDGIIRSSQVGTYVVDNQNKRAKVKAVTSMPVLLKRGDIVLAKVRMIRSSMIIADVIHVIGSKREISGDTNGTLRVSEISKGYVKEHRLIVEKVLGYVLSPQIPVHHHDENKSNNANGNLVVCEDLGYHKFLHMRTSALKACGHTHWKKCRYCKEWDDPDNSDMYVFKSNSWHRSCRWVEKGYRR